MIQKGSEVVLTSTPKGGGRFQDGPTLPRPESTRSGVALERRASVARVAYWLGISARTVRRLIHSGELDAVDLHAGRAGFARPLWAVSLHSVSRFLDRCAKEGHDDHTLGAHAEDWPV